jgi:hypothetical protein
MPKQRMHTRLSKRDIGLIIAVVDRARRDGCTVAQVVQHWLRQNEKELSWDPDEDTDEQGAATHEDDDATYRLIASETRRIRRVMRRFASWRTDDSADPSLAQGPSESVSSGSPLPRPASSCVSRPEASTRAASRTSIS